MSSGLTVAVSQITLFDDPVTHRHVYHEAGPRIFRVRCGLETGGGRPNPRMVWMHRNIATMFAEPCKPCAQKGGA